MLLLQRNQGQIVNIGEDIEIIVMSIHQNPYGYLSVKLGIEAPPEISVWRNEVFQARKNGITKLERKFKRL